MPLGGGLWSGLVFGAPFFLTPHYRRIAMLRLVPLVALLVVAPAVFAQDVPALIKQLADKDEIVRLKAAKALEKLGPAAKDALAELRKIAANDPDEDVRTVAKRALAAIGPGELADPKLAELAKALRDKTIKNRLKALGDAAKLGNDGKLLALPIVEGLVEKYPANREAYLECLEKVHPALQKHIVTLLVDQDFSAKLDSFRAIAKLKSDGAGAAPLLILFSQADRLKKFDQSVLHQEALRAMAAVAPNDPAVCKTIVGLIGTISQAGQFAEVEVRRVAIELLPDIKADKKEVVKALTAALVERDTTIRATDALAAMGPEAKESLAALNKLKLDQQKDVRDAALRAIEKITGK